MQMTSYRKRYLDNNYHTNWHGPIIANHANTVKEMTGVLNYLEIGVHTGETFNLVVPNTTSALAVDNNPDCAQHLQGGQFICSTSDEFFQSYEDDLLFEIIFIDGLHSKEQVEKDFNNSLKVLRDGGTIYMHDTWPEIESNTIPQICGDVWKFAEEVERNYERCFTYQEFPGLTMVQPDPVKRDI